MLKSDVLKPTSENRYVNQLKAVLNNLSVDGIVMPLKGVKQVLKLLHVSHVGVNKTYDLTRSYYCWPSVLNDIKQLIDNCEACALSRPS